MGARPRPRRTASLRWATPRRRPRRVRVPHQVPPGLPRPAGVRAHLCSSRRRASMPAPAGRPPGVAAVTVVVSSFWWVVIVELLPASSASVHRRQRRTTRRWTSLLGYDGLGRILGRGDPGVGAIGRAAGPAGGAGGAGGFGGAAGPPAPVQRSSGAGQIALAVARRPALGLVAGLVARVAGPRGPIRRRAAFVLWGTWAAVHVRGLLVHGRDRRIPTTPWRSRRPSPRSFGRRDRWSCGAQRERQPLAAAVLGGVVLVHRAPARGNCSRARRSSAPGARAEPPWPSRRARRSSSWRLRFFAAAEPAPQAGSRWGPAWL